MVLLSKVKLKEGPVLSWEGNWVHKAICFRCGMPPMVDGMQLFDATPKEYFAQIARVTLELYIACL